MSGIKVKGNASGTGNITIEAPNTNTDRTITLPDVAGEVLTDGQALPVMDGSNLTGLGKILQVTTTNIGSYSVSSAGTWTDAGNASITPSSTSSRILVMAVLNCAAGSTNNFIASIWKDSTELSRCTEVSGFSGRFGASGYVIDSPNTTSSVTYKVRLLQETSLSGLTGTINGTNNKLILMEIAG